MVVVQIIIVLARYVFGVGFIKLQELMIYMHGMLFTLASGYTLLHDEHVRVDVIYRESSLQYKSYINFFGSIFFIVSLYLHSYKNKSSLRTKIMENSRRFPSN